MKKIALLLSACTYVLFITGCSSSGSESASSSDSATIKSADSFSLASSAKIGVQMWTFRLFTFAQALDKVDSAGAKSIEAFWGQPLGAGLKDEFGIKMSDSSKAKVKELLAAKGIQIVAMGVISPDTKEDWAKAFDLAKEFGLSYITCEPKKDHYKYIDSLAGVYSIKLAIHDHPKPSMYWSPDSVLAVTAGHPNIGSCADIGHWARSGLNPVDCLKKLNGRVYGVHFKDITQFDNTEAPDTVVGKGILDIKAIMQELNNQKFKGMLSIEQESNWNNSLPDVTGTVKLYHELASKVK